MEGVEVVVTVEGEGEEGTRKEEEEVEEAVHL